MNMEKMMADLNDAMDKGNYVSIDYISGDGFIMHSEIIIDELVENEITIEICGNNNTFSYIININNDIKYENNEYNIESKYGHLIISVV